MLGRKCILNFKKGGFFGTPFIFGILNDGLRNNQAFYLRNKSTTKHKTLIKYNGFDLCLYARSHIDEDWKRIPDC